MKNNEHKRLDQLLKDQLSEGTAPVPGFVWDNIEEELFPEKKRRGFFWWFFGAICLLILTVLFGIAFSGEKAHSQHAALSKNTASDASRIPVLSAADDSIHKDTFIAPKPTKTKGCLQYRNPDSYRDATQTSKHSDFQPANVRLNSHRSLRNTDLRQKRSGSMKKRSHTTSLSNSKGNLSSEKPVIEQIEHASTGSDQQLVPISENPVKQSIPENPDEKAKTENGAKTDSLTKKELSYEEILALVKRDFPKDPDQSAENKRPSSFSLGIYGGPSLYNITVFKDYFTSGQLSKRTFASSGFELGLQARLKIGNRFGIYTGLVFNQKQTQFNYNLAITETDYFTYVINDEKVPLENIRDDGANSCFLAKDVVVRYQLQSALISLGTHVEFLKIGKFSAAADLRLSSNVYSSLKLRETRVLDIPQPTRETFSYLQAGAGLFLNWKINERVSVGLSPYFSKQFYLKKSVARRVDELVIPVSVSFYF